MYNYITREPIIFNLQLLLVTQICGLFTRKEGNTLNKAETKLKEIENACRKE